MNPADLHAILSGERQTLSANGWRLGLSMAEPVYTVAATFQRFLYNMRLKAIHRVRRPVISIGNLTTGGTGKTPVTALLVQQLQLRGIRPGIASRGYRSLQTASGASEGPISAAAETANDEKRMLEQMCPGVPHRQNRNRVQVAQELIRLDDCQCVLLDDGFQHRRLARDLDIVLIDAVNPFGYGHLLPRGLMREPPTSLGRADLVIITRVNQVSAERVAAIREELSYFTRKPILEIAFEPTGWLTLAGNSLPLTAPLHEPFVFCGIGNPRNFRLQLQALELTVPDERFQAFPDHYHYTAADILSLIERAGPTATLITTHKDLVKLTDLLPPATDCRALLIEAVVTEGAAALDTALTQLLQRLPPAEPPSDEDE